MCYSMEFRCYGDEGSLRVSIDYERIILSLPKHVTPAHTGLLTSERNLQQGHKKSFALGELRYGDLKSDIMIKAD